MATPDGRRDLDADVGVKTYRGQHADGTAWEKVVTWFGYRLHLWVDAGYELPVAYEVTQASASEVKQAHAIVDETARRHPEIVNRCEYFTADKGMDDGKLIAKLWDQYEIKPAIDIRNYWKDREATKLVTGETWSTTTKGRCSAATRQAACKGRWRTGGLKKTARR